MPNGLRLGRVLPVRQLCRRFEKISSYARMRLALFLAQRTRRSRGSAGRSLPSSPRTSSAWSPCRESSPTPGPSGTGGQGRMPSVNGVGERVRENRTHGSMRRGLETEQSATASPRPYASLMWWPEGLASEFFQRLAVRCFPAVAPGGRGSTGPGGSPSWSLGWFWLVSRTAGPAGG